MRLEVGVTTGKVRSYIPAPLKNVDWKELESIKIQSILRL